MALKALIVYKGLSRGSLISYDKLADAIESRFERSILNWLRAPVRDGNRPATWLRRLLDNANHKKRKAVLYFLLVIGSLCESVADFENAVADLSLNHFGKAKQWDYFKSLDKAEYKATDHAPLWALNLRCMIEVEKLTICAIAWRFDITPWKVAKELQRQNIRAPLSKATKSALGQKLRAIRSDLRRGVAKRTICENWGCSDWILTLIELDMPGLNADYRAAIKKKCLIQHRKRLLEYLSKHQKAGRSDILTDLPATYESLSQFNRDWFYSQIPRKKSSISAKPRPMRRLWTTIDSEKAKELELAFGELLNIESKPVQITKTFALKRIRLLSSYSRHSEKFPKVNDVLRRFVETRPDFLKRRILWAITELVKSGESLSLLSLRKISNLTDQILKSHETFILDTATRLNATLNSKSYFGQSQVTTIKAALKSEAHDY